jgi:hypothetical protein
MEAIFDLIEFEPVTQLDERLATATGMIGVMSTGDVEKRLGLLKQMLPTVASRGRRRVLTLTC